MLVIELRERAAQEAQAARDIKDKADEESRGLTADEATDLEKHLNEADRLAREADMQERLEKTEDRLNKPEPRQAPGTISDGSRIETPTPDMFRFGQLRAFRGPNANADAYRSGKWLLATVMRNPEARQWCRDHGVAIMRDTEARVQTEGVSSAGGFLVPTEMERAIIDLREQYGMFRANARIMPMSSDHMLIPRRSGGVTAYFVGETTEITASDKSWNQVELTAKKLGALTRMSTDLSEDAIINIADDLAQEMAWAFAKKEDECGLDGDGTNTYGGIIGIRTRFVDGNHTAGQDAGTTPYTAWSHGTLADEVITLMSLLPAYATARAKWYINPAGKAGLLDRIALEAGGNTTQNIAAGAQPSFAGYPIVTSAAMPSAPTNGTVAFLFGDLSLSTTFGDRRGITIKVSTERYIEYDQIGIQATERFCIVNHDLGDTSTAGPIVASVGTT
jgi:HK97 family phage major capsid protein